MTVPFDERSYEFDVAVSFAGEDRELVEGIVGRLKSAGISVFYDSDYQADLWGEDLIEFLDEIYRLKARYTIMFISSCYAQKMWTRHERRSALARAMEQRSAYVLPVRLDSTQLEGLRPTVGYLDARLVGPDGIVDATVAKLAGIPPAENAAITQVPRSEAQRQQVLLLRPQAWEHLYFAAKLLHERNKIEPKYRDHEIHYSRSTGEVVKPAGVASYISSMINDCQLLIGKLSKLVNDEVALERALGKPGEAGDPEVIAHLAMRWNSIYEEFLDWAASVRGSRVPSGYLNLIELMSRYMDGPISQYREFVDEFVEKIDELPAATAAGRVLSIELHLILSIPSETVRAYNAEWDRVEEQLKKDTFVT
jgi:hypothetical protein